MKETTKIGLLALLEGDRNSILNLFPYESDDQIVIWLKACSVEDITEQKRLLQMIIQSPTSDFKNIAIKILEREQKFDALLSIPPTYKFWARKDKALVEDYKKAI